MNRMLMKGHGSLCLKLLGIKFGYFHFHNFQLSLYILHPSSYFSTVTFVAVFLAPFICLATYHTVIFYLTSLHSTHKTHCFNTAITHTTQLIHESSWLLVDLKGVIIRKMYSVFLFCVYVSSCPSLQRQDVFHFLVSCFVSRQFFFHAIKARTLLYFFIRMYLLPRFIWSRRF